jgi:hypothetical protein
MFRIPRIVPTTVLTVAVLALAAPVAQARPFIEPSGGTTFANPSVQSTQDFNTYSTQRVHRDAGLSAGWRVHRALGSVVVTTGDTPLKNPVKGSETLGALHRNSETLGAGFVHTSSGAGPTAVPASQSDGFDWTAGALGAGLASILLLMLGVGVGFRRRGQLAA